MKPQEREKLRKLQDKVLNLYVTVKFERDHGKQTPIFPGGPTIEELKTFLFPQHADKFKNLVLYNT